MRKIPWLSCLIFVCLTGRGQTAGLKLAEAVQQLESDSQMRHAILGIVVADAKTGEIIFARNEQTGLAAASTQKIITGAAAFEMLGNDYRYKTRIGYSGKPDKNGVVNGHLYILGSGDPTLGSWRYSGTKDSFILSQWTAIIKKNIRRISGGIAMYDGTFSSQVIPDGWIWQDIGNYYGAGACALNWKENQYDLVLASGDQAGSKVRVIKSGDIISENGDADALIKSRYDNELKAAARGSGDNAYIYLPVNGTRSLLKGTIPAGENAFKISGALPDPQLTFHSDLSNALSKQSPFFTTPAKKVAMVRVAGKAEVDQLTMIHTHLSPPLDSIHYWFMRRSINLYGEALIKTIALEKAGYGDTDTGLKLVKDFWAGRGISRNAINIIDGSGLSPQNRITADALLKILLFARSRPWYNSFFESLPTYNGMKLKSGSIGGARAFAGYHTSAKGQQYAIVIIVNNYSGSSAEIVKKMFKVLDLLK
ncbi:MAG TPA: D-alanyl-D-alanine carboxypeptidase/D-alanyl-D-alanine-endopeptidase [Chitinophagaceae bacterium]